MGKGIFIIPEIPPYCLRCPFEVCGGNSYYCDLYESITVSLKPMPLTNRQEKPGWCPIKEIPERCEEIKFPHSMNDFQRKGFSRGFNACLDQICDK